MRFVVLSLVLLCQVSFSAEVFSKAATLKPVLTQKGKEKNWCPICGMDIKNYYKTSHASKLHNQRDRQYCSMHCLAVDMQEYGIDETHIKVIDAHTQKFIDAHKAFYVIGSKVNTSMTNLSKLAFEEKQNAQKFMEKFGGTIVGFHDALQQTKDSLGSDIARKKKVKEKKTYLIGKKIYEAKCTKDIDLTKFLEINELKSAILNENLCKPLKTKHFHALSLYLWDVKRHSDLDEIVGKIELKEGEKCPVCGMFTYKYPKWAAQIFYKHKDHEHHYSFDGVKDMMKFYFNPLKWGDYTASKKKNITKILVTDYYSQKAIDATKAYYVIRSDTYGPMGHELIPFKTKQDAQTFKIDHQGKHILYFKDITEEEVYKLDN
jgi:nitrous oxide reductase accessory protein NosL